MQMKPFRAFGLVFIVNTHLAGERYKNMIDEPDCTIFCARGHELCTDLDTGESMPDYGQGQFHSPETNYLRGRFQLDVCDETVIYCYDPKLNLGRKQKFEPVILDGATQTILRKNSRFILCEGQIEIEGTFYDAPARISIESGDKFVTAVRHSLGLLLV